MLITNLVRRIIPAVYTSNNTSGELEATFMTSVCRSSNLQALVDTCDLPKQTEPLLAAYRSVISEDHRGTRLADESHHPLNNPPCPEVLDNEYHQLILDMLNKKFGTMSYTSDGDQILSVTRCVQQLAKVSIRGVVYAHAKSLPRDSNVLFRQLGRSTDPRVGMISSIFRLQHPTPDGPMMEATYILVHEYLRLSDPAMQSQYMQFGFAGGFLCHSKRWSGFHVIEPHDIICHFAKTVIQQGDKSVMHVLPLNKVGVSTFVHTCHLIVNQDDGILRSPFRPCNPLVTGTPLISSVIFI